MPDLISTTASALTLMDRLKAWIRRGAPPRTTSRPRHWIELLPLDYRVELHDPVPRVFVRAHVINYSMLGVEVVAGDIWQLAVPNGQMLSRIPLQDMHEVPGRSWKVISFGRDLVHGEPEMLQGPDRWSQSDLLASLRVRTWLGAEKTFKCSSTGYMNGRVFGGRSRELGPLD